ncbi:MAG: GNAT family N-acetyltransferase [Thaumarchaeota archaeon]|nr:GNAT family N-acetyltransferase [Nitrososphaerota archaeon]
MNQPSADYIVGAVKKEELQDMININLKTLPEHYTDDFYLELIQKFPEGCLVAKANGVIVGYILNRVELNFGSFGLNLTKKGHVVSVAVLEDYRRKGIGRSLIELSIAAMKKRGCKEIFLEVRISNDEAINLYKKLGFTITKTIGGYYTNGEAAYVMERPI